jgi:hypothetical protein
LTEKFEIKAVHEKNLEAMLESMQLLQLIKEEKLSCRFCGKTITLNNFQCIYPKNNEILFCCYNLACFEQALNDSKGEKQTV